MQKAVEDYIAAKKMEQAEQKKAQLDTLLIREGLFEKEYGNFAFYEENVESDETGIYKKRALELSHEEYTAIQDYLPKEDLSRPDGNESSNPAAIAVTVIAVLEIVAGFILGFVFGIETYHYSTYWNWGIILACWGGGAVSGIFTLGFAEIIKLLQRIADKK